MKPIIKSYYCTEIDDLSKYSPAEPDNFCFELRLLIGTEDTSGEESFDLTVCTPKWLNNKLKNDFCIFGLQHFIVTEFNLHKILSEIQKLCDQAPTSSWQETAQFLSKFMYWEFENYHE